MEKTLTIIVPAYNAEKYLDKGLSSFVAAGIYPDLEVLIINDGSTDRTGEIANQYAQKYPDIFQVVTKPNGGHGSGINTGMKLAKGKYFKVIDADDWIISENLKSFLAILDQTDADIVLTSFHEVDMATGNREEWKMAEPDSFYNRTHSFEDIAEHWNTLEKVFQFHGITYRTEFYRSLHYEVLEHIFYEDQEYSTYPFAHAATVLPCNLFIYEYMVGNADQSISDANRVKRLWMLKKVIDQLQEGFKKEASLSPAQKTYYENKLAGLIIDYYMISCILDPDRKEGRKKAEEFQKEMKAAHKQLSDKTDRQYRIFMLANALRLSPKTYDALLHSKLYKTLRG